MKSTERTILGFMLGAAAGAALGILFAPQKGSETRKRIKREFDYRREQLDDFVEDMRDILEEGKESFREAMREGKDKIMGKNVAPETEDNA